MANLEVWRDYVTVINAARLNAIRDHIITNEGNISYQQTLINTNTTNIYRNTSAINFNTDNISNLSNIKLSRDGSQAMTGELVCSGGLKTNSIDSTTGTITSKKSILFEGDLYGSSASGLNLYSSQNFFYASQIILEGGDIVNPGKIVFLTPTTGGGLVERIEIPGGTGMADITLINANLVPSVTDASYLGKANRKWKEIYAVRGVFDIVNGQRNMPFHLENPSSSDKYLLGAGTVSTMYQFNTTVTLTGYKLMMLTSASNGYIKVTIDDAKGWSYEKTYSLGSAGGYRYNESFTHIIETDNGIQLKISNCSHISSTSIVLEYK